MTDKELQTLPLGFYVVGFDGVPLEDIQPKLYDYAADRFIFNVRVWMYGRVMTSERAEQLGAATWKNFKGGRSQRPDGHWVITDWAEAREDALMSRQEWEDQRAVLEGRIAESWANWQGGRL